MDMDRADALQNLRNAVLYGEDFDVVIAEVTCDRAGVDPDEVDRVMREAIRETFAMEIGYMVMGVEPGDYGDWRDLPPGVGV